MNEPTLLLIHGLGATRNVWVDVIDRLDWAGRVVAPDLPGHGAAPWTGDYTVGALSAAVAAECEPGEQVIAAGHSLGGGVALCLASQMFRPQVVGVIGLGIKTVWTDDDVASMARVAERGRRPFATRDEAVEKFLRAAGLADVVAADHPATQDAVVELDGQWLVAQDPATFAQRALNMSSLVAAATCPVVLGAGDGDLMVSRTDLAAYTHEPVMADSSGHNVHVEQPAWVCGLIRSMIDMCRGQSLTAGPLTHEIDGRPTMA